MCVCWNWPKPTHKRTGTGTNQHIVHWNLILHRSNEAYGACVVDHLLHWANASVYFIYFFQNIYASYTLLCSVLLGSVLLSARWASSVEERALIIRCIFKHSCVRIHRIRMVNSHHVELSHLRVCVRVSRNIFIRIDLGHGDCCALLSFFLLLLSIQRHRMAYNIQFQYILNTLNLNWK